MPVIADYTTISDEFFVLAKGGELRKELPVTLPPGLDLDSPAVLVFKVVSLDAMDLKFRVMINGSEQQWAKYAGGAVCSLHEVVEGLKAGDNSVIFEYESGDGTLRVGDVVLWFKREL